MRAPDRVSGSHVASALGRCPRRTLHQARRRLALALLVIATCTDATSHAGDLDVRMAASIDAAFAGAAEAFDKATRISVRVVVGQDAVFEEELAFDPDDEARVRVRLPRSLAGSAIRAEIALAAPEGVLFEGSGDAVVREEGPTVVPVTLRPVIGSIDIAEPITTFTAIGERRRLTAAAVFATGDTLPGTAIAWRTLDPSIVTVQSDGNAEARAEGEARIEATAGSVSRAGRAVVHADVFRVTVAPSEAELVVGEQIAIQAAVYDRNGNALSRSVTWTSENVAVAVVDAMGIATALRAGATMVQATADGVTGRSALTVRDAPAAPTDLTITLLSESTRSYELRWVDRSSDEEHFAIEQSVDDGIWSEVARAGAGATAYTGTGAPGENRFRVLACNARGCSAPSNTASATFPAGPVVTTNEPSGIGVMHGSVRAAGNYTVRFQYGDSPEDLAAGGRYQETRPRTGTGDADFSEPIPDGTAGAATYYRIVAVSALGTFAGDVRGLTLPAIGTRGSLQNSCSGADVTARAWIDVSGDDGNPISSVVFHFAGSDYYDGYDVPGVAREDSSPSTSGSGSVTRYEYRRDWSPSTMLGSAWVDITVNFVSGASALAEPLQLVGSGSQCAAPQ